MADYYTDARAKITRILAVKKRFELKDLVTHIAVDDTTCAACGGSLPRFTRTFWCSLKRLGVKDTIDYAMIHRDLVLCKYLADPDDKHKLP